ncbi:selenium binding protein (plasmid) [Limosilactobacillus reuteri]|uniref:Selenium binding protein n=1 Tax=Limosilactobacillus reuteri TaxID=1598 RepID=A0A517D8I2_LIMRT|nr:selenium binding protein [Limosilactobacillus reuteri]QDR73634.1 selenium binding protein [Limosilactobacillus reuteri]
MYENYTRQALPDKNYRELLGTAICAFNANNAFMIENLLSISDRKTWWDLIDEKSGTIGDLASNCRDYRDIVPEELKQLFQDIVKRRNRIIHSYQITSNTESQDLDGQILATKDNKTNVQFIITEEYLKEFINDNAVLSDKLYNLRDSLSNN